jgi:uncharacterized protein
MLWVMDSTPPLANVITLGVRDIARERDFYRRFGWPIVTDDGNFVVFELRGMVLALFPLEQLARDAHAPEASAVPGIRSSLIISVDRPDDVDKVAEQARAAGATITKEPTDAEFFEGRDCYFADPEDNYWEIAWAPGTNAVVAAARRAANLPV